uniref:Secreted protein n=1 Tax=Utricularia reniformis TaxID=192314 RepID=A0A1Y0B333_9LAMI|nr:hypothetical protein AEK19_MT1658 [Utricularia reniformis]ART31842.1 hypothetical protein AEK19_MT1658 [Utricularia reniformis]
MRLNLMHWLGLLSFTRSLTSIWHSIHPLILPVYNLSMKCRNYSRIPRTGQRDLERLRTLVSVSNRSSTIFAV